MKKILIGILMIILLTGCTKDSAGSTAEELIEKMVTCSTYSDKNKNEENLPRVLEGYFSEEGYKTCVDNQMIFMYPELFRIMQAKETKNIKIKEEKKIKQRDNIKFTYKVEYTIVCKNKKIKMKDTIVIKLDKKNKITEVLMLNTSDVMHKLFLDVRIL